MDKLVLDTNVIVSALIGKGNPRRILELVFEKKAALYLSPSTMNEYVNVLRREKFSRYRDFYHEAHNVLSILKRISVSIQPAIRLNVCPDADDNKFLELAVEVNANYLITGNKKHFPSQQYLSVQIVSPLEYVKFRRVR